MFEFNNVFEQQNQLAPLKTVAIAQQANGAVATPGVTDTTGAAYTPVVVPGGQTTQGGFFKNQDGTFNGGNAQLALGAVQTLGSLWNSFQQNKLAKKSLELQTRAFETNLANETQSYNTSLEDRIRARYHSEGRSDQADGYIAEHSL